MCAQSNQAVPREDYLPLENAKLFYREIGRGQPLIILHGGPDFDHTYLLPDMDRLADAYHLIYYDQRGRGKSIGDIQPEAISIETEIEDLERLRGHLQLDSIAVLGHSWGGILALEYAIRHSERVSHMILMNTAPASQEDVILLRQEISKRIAPYQEKMNALKSSPAYVEGDPDTVAAYYRFWFSTTIKQPQHLETVLQQMRLSFMNTDVVQARAIETQLYKETFTSSEFNLFPRLKQLRTPTLVLHGDYDFIPRACAEHIAQVIPGTRFVLLQNCGHFSYIESPDAARKVIDDFFRG